MTYPKKISISHQSVLESLYYVKVNRKNLQICNSGFLSTKLVYRLEFTKEHEEKIAEENTTIDQTINPNIKQQFLDYIRRHYSRKENTNKVYLNQNLLISSLILLIAVKNEM